MKDIRFGIAGAGDIARRRFAPTLISDETPGAVLRAVASASSIERAKQFAADFSTEGNTPKFYGSYQELADDPDVDVVYIATTHNFHYENAKFFLNAGKPVLCEKPFFLTRREAEEIVELAAKKNLFLMEGMWTRCLPSFQKAKEWAQSGAIGEVKLIEAMFCRATQFDAKSRLVDPFTAGGVLYDMGVYPILYATGIVGEAPHKISALSVPTPLTGADETTVVDLYFPNGALAQTSSSFRVTGVNDAVIYGTEGKIIARDFHKAKTCERYDADGNLAETFTSEFSDGFVFEILHVAELLRAGKKESPLMPLADTIACAGIFDEVKRIAYSC